MSILRTAAAATAARGGRNPAVHRRRDTDRIRDQAAEDEAVVCEAHSMPRSMLCILAVVNHGGAITVCPKSSSASACISVRSRTPMSVPLTGSLQRRRPGGEQDARLQSMTKEAGVPLLLFEGVGRPYPAARSVDRHFDLRGVSGPQEMFTLGKEL